MNSLIKKIDDMIEERSLLKHPFYEMWSSGKLKLESLTGYSKEYFQLVKAVPSLMSPIIEQAPNSVINELVHNQKEESSHIRPWIKFAGTLGVSEEELIKYEGRKKTKQAISKLFSLMNTYEGGACAMYAFEKEIPKISQIKMDGLAAYYGISSAEATEYFQLHTEADIRHTAAWRKVLEKSYTDPEVLTKVADDSITAQNMLLDSCYEGYC